MGLMANKPIMLSGSRRFLADYCAGLKISVPDKKCSNPIGKNTKHEPDVTGSF